MVKVAIFGAAGGIGQSLSLLVKLDQNVDELALYDVVNAPGVGQDLSHINTKAKLSSYLPENDGLAKSLENTDIVVIPAGVPRKPGMTRDDLFKINASIIRDLAEGIATYGKKDVFILVISNPVNSTVPMVAEVLKKFKVYNPKRLVGVTTLDLVRSNEFLKQMLPEDKIDSSNLFVPVIGGHSGDTIVPLFSIGCPEYYKKLSTEQRESLIHRVQYGGDEVVKAKKGMGSATLSMAYAGYRLTSSFIKTFKNEVSKEVAFIELNDQLKGAKEAKKIISEKYGGSHIDYFALPLILGKDGIEEVDYKILEQADEKEQEMIEIAVKQLEKNIVKGKNFISGIETSFSA
ncbi:hypothetical protein PACTADRAFT_73807 [Pachysolen tannophilus NRRL Y-2460]|uniref:Malate dehydrogenase n=1 Tax=Pachysolen tannophilus NRRL Y-2460 TaxID=669874 RepID=A0A1E4U2I6_PACTA|nr:hypothetical protein PACTADRAFT_73807 [Pachysolen tannophilus NRRL Y-2460]